MLINKKNFDNKVFFIFIDLVYISLVLCFFNKKKLSKYVMLLFFFYVCF